MCSPSYTDKRKKKERKKDGEMGDIVNVGGV